MSVDVRFRDPQPGHFPVGTKHGGVVFVDGYATVDEADLREWEKAGLAIERVPVATTDDAPAPAPAPKAEKATAPARGTAAKTATRKRS